MWNWIDKLKKFKEENQPFVMVTIVSSKGSTPRNPGTRMLIKSELQSWGTIGGGKLELLVLSEAQKCLQTGDSKLVSYRLCEKTGQCCGGAVEVFMEVFNVQPNLYIFGAGHVGQSLAQVLEGTDLNVNLIDERKQWIESESLPESVNSHACSWADFVGKIKWNKENSCILIATPSHETDFEILNYMLGKPHLYLGMIGSRSKWVKFQQKLINKGFELEQLQKVRCPVGLDIGGNSPREIAISIAAELLKTTQALKRKEYDIFQKQRELLELETQILFAAKYFP